MNNKIQSSWKKFSSLCNAAPKTVYVDSSSDTEICVTYTKEFIQFKSKNKSDSVFKIPIEYNDYWQITQFTSENKSSVVEFDIKPQLLSILEKYLNFLPVFILNIFYVLDYRCI